jgi:assimilatory nitrate reductase catalytic subunit
VQWPLSTHKSSRPRHVYDGGQFYTPCGKARFIAVAPRSPAHPSTQDFPLILNTGRVRDQWHTMTRTGKSPRLSSHTPEPRIEMHPEDARAYHLHEDMLMQIRSRWGTVIGRVHISQHQPRGSIFMPIHWNNQYASRARIDTVVNPVSDPVSGEPEFKHTPVGVGAYRPRWYGFVLSREPVDFSEVGYWILANGEQFRRYELAGEAAVANWDHWSRLKLGHSGEWLEFEDGGTGRYRGARIVHGRLHACIFVSPSHELPARNWLMALFDKVRLGKSRIVPTCLRAVRPTIDWIPVLSSAPATKWVVTPSSRPLKAKASPPLNRSAHSAMPAPIVVHVCRNCANSSQRITRLMSRCLETEPLAVDGCNPPLAYFSIKTTAWGCHPMG